MAEVLPENHLRNIVTYIKKIFTKMFPVLREECKETVESVNANVVTSCLNFV